MEIKKIITPILLATLLLAAGCSKERQVGTPDQGTPIRFGVSVPGGINALTRAETPISLEGKQVGIFAYSYTGVESWPVSPSIYQNEEATGTALVGAYYPLTVETSMNYVPSATHAFYAYQPYTADLTSSTTVSRDLFTDLDGTVQKDWTWVKKIGVMPSNNPVELTLDHMMSMVRFAFKKEANIATVLTLDKIEIGTSTSQKFTFNVSTGAVTSESGGSTTFAHNSLAYAVPTAYTTPLNSTLLLPSSVITSLSFTVNGEVYTTDAWSLVTEQGKFKVIEVNIKETEIVITIGGQDWKPGEDTDLTNGNVTISIGDGGWAYEPGSDTDLRNGSTSISIGSQGWKDGGTNDLRPQP